MLSMPERLMNFVAEHSLFGNGDRLLLAVSGGLDSSVLVHMFRRAGFDIQLMHVNFELRGDESERDEHFVAAMANHYGLPLYSKRANAHDYAEKYRCSIQEAAREIRYSWFEELRHDSEKKPAWILTGHHLDDNIETSLKHFISGTGIRGLRGMLPKQGAIVRPLLWASREELENYARAEQLEWVEDRSNADEHYTRNYIRRQIIPLLDQVHPQARLNMAQNLQRFREAEELYQQALDRHRHSLLFQKGEEWHVPIEKLRKATPIRTILFELSRPFGFTAAQTDELIRLLDAGSGRQISSSTHRAIRHRNWLLFAPIQAEHTARIIVDDIGHWHVHNGTLTVALKRQLPGDWAGHANECWVPREKIQFPLQLRGWQKGDYFYPFGLGKKKKLARYFIDQKLSTTAKENQWVLEMAGKIIWLAGLRSDERFRVSGHEKEWVQFVWTPRQDS